MDTKGALQRYLYLKNNLIPATQQQMQDLKVDIFGAEVTLRGIEDKNVFIDDFKWEIRTRGFTIFNLIYLPSIITFVIFLVVIILVLAGIGILGVILETLIRTFILFQDYEFEDTFIYIPIKAIEDFIYFPPSIPLSIIVGLLMIWLLYSFVQIKKNKVYYEEVVIPENRKKNALVPGQRKKQQAIVDKLKNTFQTTETQLLNYQNELQNIMKVLPIPNQYWSSDETINFLIKKLEFGQARTIGEALNLWEKELQTRRAEQAAKDLIRETREAEQRLARQRAEQHAQAQKNLKDNTESNNRLAEEEKRRNDRIERYERNGWL